MTQHRITRAMLAAYINNDDNELRRLLGLRPWELSPLDAFGACNRAPGTMSAQSWPKAVALREALEEVAKTTTG